MSNVTVKLVKSWLRRLPENKWRKTYKIDAKRIAHFARLGEDTELPQSLVSKTSNGYIAIAMTPLPQLGELLDLNSINSLNSEGDISPNPLNRVISGLPPNLLIAATFSISL